MDALYGFLIMQGYIMKQEYNRFHYSAVYTYVLFGFIFAFNSLIKRLGLVYLGGCFWEEVYDIICYTNKIKGKRVYTTRHWLEHVRKEGKKKWKYESIVWSIRYL